MAWEAEVKYIPGAVAAGDLSSDQFKFGVTGASGVVIASSAGQVVDGVIQNKPDAAGKVVQIAYQGAVKVYSGAAVAKGALVMPNASAKAITAAAAPTAASKTGGAQNYVLTAGATIVVDVDNVGNATCTWDAAAGTITDTTTYPVADQDGLTSIITIDGGTAQTVTFSGVTTTAASVAAQMNDQLVGCSVSVVGGQVQIDSDSQGTGSSVTAAAGTGGLTWAAPVAGTGDVVNIKAVTAAEVETVIEADSTAEVTITSGIITITSPTTGTTSELDFISGTALTPLGLSVETITGADPGTYFAGRALEAASGADEIFTVLLETGKN
jgi:hypothetical protein